MNKGLTKVGIGLLVLAMAVGANAAQVPVQFVGTGPGMGTDVSNGDGKTYTNFAGILNMAIQWQPGTPVVTRVFCIEISEKVPTNWTLYNVIDPLDGDKVPQLDGWLDMVKSYALVGSYRHPVAVARSLAKRNLMPKEEAYDLWLRYNAELVRQHEVDRFPIVRFDLSDAEEYCRTIASLAVTLGLEPRMRELREFVSADLDRNRCQERPVPPACREMYAYLEHHRHQPTITTQPATSLQRAPHV